MVRDQWESMRKTARNAALYKYVEEHPEATYEEVGREFNITKQRAWELLKNEEKRKATEQAPVA